MTHKFNDLEELAQYFDELAARSQKLADNPVYTQKQSANFLGSVKAYQIAAEVIRDSAIVFSIDVTLTRNRGAIEEVDLDPNHEAGGDAAMAHATRDID